ncbi:hypothetical protein OOK44_36100 [Streptomyces cellulosae]|uniref:Uncharacterized protein n=1 Tax=Streptomyces althioticus TaxID=83380 RepID=A0ABZ1YFL9_9ACTN|nr:hypothetical protein [Streptomyces cellulosae]WTB93426.1 hypothetical protein OIE99_34850 [Streptomyces cellulosae]WTC60817.1 hypothetical protein OH715_36600 [Streptomyces cellulosae]
MATRTQLLVDAMGRGEQIVEIRSNAPVKHLPRSEHDKHPWVVWEPGLRQEFRLTSNECMVSHRGSSAAEVRSGKLNALAEESRLRKLDALAREAEVLIGQAGTEGDGTWETRARSLLRKLTDLASD